MEQRRIVQTLIRVQEAGFPTAAAAADNLVLESINGGVCTGCGEAISPRDLYHSVRLRMHALGLLRFHPVCYDAWARFEPSFASGETAAGSPGAAANACAT